MTFEVGQAFLDRARSHLRDDYLPRLVIAVEALGDAHVWRRANEQSNSAANLCLHLAGNARQWIVAGVGGATDTRERQAEFDARDGLTAMEIIARTRAAFADIDATLARVTPDQLGAPRHIQGHDTTVFAAIFHVCEHVAMHVGQVILLAKAWGTTPIAFYTVTPEGIATRTWDGSQSF
ncbi:MAG: DUF1572 domain-containing protein [Gemmatimonadaceae bacterium]|jgi:uncharacterized damage-inducible protein DinB|nr:DUF1572 domain-containing protein [Gemmatimonadaceae bacterium]